MSDFIGKLSVIFRELNLRDNTLTFKLAGENTYDVLQLADEMHICDVNGKNLEISIAMKRLKRSLTANSLCWFWCKQIAMKLHDGNTTIDVYKKNVREAGIFEVYRVERNSMDSFKKTWEKRGTANFIEKLDTTEDGYIIIAAYQGSSSYNTKQMSRLLNCIKQDAISVGVPIEMDPQIEKMLEGSRR